MSAFVVSNRNIVIPSPDGREKTALHKGYIGPVPDWAAKTAYFKALVKDGKLVLSASKSDKALEKERRAAEKARLAAEEAARLAAEEAARLAVEGESGAPEAEGDTSDPQQEEV